jgi:hypothetical protein
MTRTVKKPVALLLLVIAIAAMTALPVFAETITLRSGGGYAFGQNDPAWTYLIGPPGAALSASPFTAADFSAALTGPQSFVVPPYGGFWAASLACDNQAQWISTDPNRGPATALYGHTFDVQTCCIGKAYLNFCWAADDNIGDQLYGGANPMGVYLNGTPLAVTGGNYAGQTTASVEVTGLLHCGHNDIFVYNRDAAYVVTGVMFSVTMDIVECPLATQPTTWGAVKKMYR